MSRHETLYGVYPVPGRCVCTVGTHTRHWGQGNGSRKCQIPISISLLGLSPLVQRREPGPGGRLRHHKPATTGRAAATVAMSASNAGGGDSSGGRGGGGGGGGGGEPDSPTRLRPTTTLHERRHDAGLQTSSPAAFGVTGGRLDPDSPSSSHMRLCMRRYGVLESGALECKGGAIVASRGPRCALYLKSVEVANPKSLALELYLTGVDTKAAMHTLKAFLEHSLRVDGDTAPCSALLTDNARVALPATTDPEYASVEAATALVVVHRLAKKVLICGIAPLAAMSSDWSAAPEFRAFLGVPLADVVRAAAPRAERLSCVGQSFEQIAVVAREVLEALGKDSKLEGVTFTEFKLVLQVCTRAHVDMHSRVRVPLH